MTDVIDLALRVASTDSTILISGESGVGKSLLARMIHRASERKAGAIMQINCAAIPESLIESELFGYEPGSFTGADRRGREGLVITSYSIHYTKLYEMILAAMIFDTAAPAVRISEK